MEPKSQVRIAPDAAGRSHRPVLRHLAMTAISGLLAGAIAGGTVILLDIGTIGTLVARSTDPLLAAATVLAPFALVGAVAGGAIGLLPYLRKLRR